MQSVQSRPGEKAVVVTGGVTVVVVEHNMELVMNVADRVLVMDYGQHLFEGVPADVQKNAAVVSAYLGGELM